MDGLEPPPLADSAPSLALPSRHPGVHGGVLVEVPVVGGRRYHVVPLEPVDLHVRHATLGGGLTPWIASCRARGPCLLAEVHARYVVSTAFLRIEDDKDRVSDRAFILEPLLGVRTTVPADRTPGRIVPVALGSAGLVNTWKYGRTGALATAAVGIDIPTGRGHSVEILLRGRLPYEFSSYRPQYGHCLGPRDQQPYDYGYGGYYPDEPPPAEEPPPDGTGLMVPYYGYGYYGYYGGDSCVRIERNLLGGASLSLTAGLRF